MSVESESLPASEDAQSIGKGTSTFSRVAKYAIVRLIILFITVAIGVYLTILIANMGGYVDRIMAGQIREGIAITLQYDENYRAMEPSERQAYLENLVSREEHRLGLDQPFVVRSFRYLSNALTLRLGYAQLMTSDTGSKQVK